MGDFQVRPNTGSIFKNDEKERPEDRDYSGSLNVDGVDHWVSGWVKTAKSGKKFPIALSQAQAARRQRQARRQA
jgi:hypothetical protein